MPLVLIDRARETTTTTGTGSVTLLGAVLGYQTLAAVGNTNTTWYCIADIGGANWEVGVGTYSTSGPTLARTTVLASSNSGNLVNFPAGTKDVFVTQPAEKVFPTDITLSGNLTANSLSLGVQSIATSGGTTTLTVNSPYYTVFTGTQGQTLVLPNATTLNVGWKYGIDNDSTQAIAVNANGGGAFWIIAPGCDSYITCTGVGSAAGTWEKDYAAAKLANGKSLNVSNTLTFTGTDASSVAFGAGGTVLYSGGALGTPASGVLTNTAGYLYTGRKNKLINGSMRFWQYATTAAIIGAGSYPCADRWCMRQSVATGATVSQVASGLANFQYALKYGRNAGNTNVNAVWATQALETFDSIPLQGKTVTLSFWAKAGANFSAASSYMQLRICTGTGTDQAAKDIVANSWTGAALPVDLFQAITTSWVRYSFTAAISATATQVGVAMLFTPVGTAGADDNLYITGVQLEEGSYATNFENITAAEELALCLRYYECTTLDLAGCTIEQAYLTAYVTGRRFTSKKRAAPTVVLYSRSGTANKLSKVSDGANIGGTVTAGSVTDSGFASCYDATAPFTVNAYYEVAFTAASEL
jgi:hypothetical protein